MSIIYYISLCTVTLNLLILINILLNFYVKTLLSVHEMEDKLRYSFLETYTEMENKNLEVLN